MTPQLVDLNADGHPDMIAATFEGTAFFMEGTEDGFKGPEYIMDEKNEMVRISFYYNMDDDEFQNVDRSSEDEENNEIHHMTSIAAVDWDADGDQDLILGAYEGALYLCMNNGTARRPNFSATNSQIKADGEYITMDGLATPRVCDWDGDGLFDILCGGSKGGVYFYRNTGAEGAPEFATGETLIEQPEGHEVPTIDGRPTMPGKSYHIEVIDYDGDNDLDLLVGGQSYYEQEEKELTDEEKTELEELEEKSEAVREKMSAMFEDIEEQEEMEEIHESEEYEKITEEVMLLMARRYELQPHSEAANYVWLYRNNSDPVGAELEDASGK